MAYLRLVVAMLRKASFMGAFFLLLSTPLYAASTDCSIEPAITTAFAVKRVIDGDTLRLHDGRGVRLIGLDAPEMGGRGLSAQPYAVQATRRLAALVKANGDAVHLRLGEESHDRYGRVLAYAYDAKGASFAEQLIAQGLAFHAQIAPNTLSADCLVKAEQRAQQATLGLWKSARYTPVQKIKGGGFNLLQGRIQSVQRNKGGVGLELGHTFTVNIPQQSIAYFTDQAFEQWQGRNVRVRGWVVDRKVRSRADARWRLTVSHPSMLELQ